MVKSFHQTALSKIEGSPFNKLLANRTTAANIVQRALRHNNYLKKSILQNEKGAIALEAGTGEFYIFTSENFHASIPNSSPDTRVAIALRYSRAKLKMSETKNMKTLIDMIPNKLRKHLISNSSHNYILSTIKKALGKNTSSHGDNGKKKEKKSNHLDINTFSKKLIPISNKEASLHLEPPFSEEKKGLSFKVLVTLGGKSSSESKTS